VRLFAGSVVPIPIPVEYPYQLSYHLQWCVYIMPHNPHKSKTMLEIPVAHRSHEVAASARQFAACPGNGMMLALGPAPVSKNVVLLTMIMVFDETVEVSVVEPVGRLNADMIGEMTGMVDAVEVTVNVVVSETVNVVTPAAVEVVVVAAAADEVVVVTAAAVKVVAVTTTAVDVIVVVIAGVVAGSAVPGNGGLYGATVVSGTVRVDSGVTVTGL